MQRSLSSRLTFHIITVVLVMIAIITGLVYYQVRDSMLVEAQARYLGILRQTQGETRRMANMVDMATLNNAHDIEDDLDDPDKMFDHVERIVRLSNDIACCYLWFEPNYYPSKGRLFIPCARRGSDGSVKVSQIDSISHNDFSEAWCLDQMREDTCNWTKPYFESQLFAGDEKPRLLKTFVVPIHNPEGRPVALLCSDLSLESMQQGVLKQMERAHQQYEEGCSQHSYNFSFSYNGTYVNHPDKKRMVSRNFWEDIKETTDTLDDRLLKSMMKNQEGSAMVNIDGVPSWIYYQNIKQRKLINVIVVPEEVIFHNGRRLNTIILLLMLAGLVAIYFICRHEIRKTMSPLQRFAQAADNMALGNFSTPLPEIKGGDEVRQMHDAFENMQTSLSIYIDELQKTTTQKASLESELKIANTIQMAMLPKNSLSLPGGEIELYASLTPALEVGGDLYDYFLEGDKLFFCIGDVSGKGVPAALMMAVVRGMFRSESRWAESAEAVVDTMNRHLCEEYKSDIFVTMFVGILDLATGRLDFCNAGHESPMLADHLLSVNLNLPIGALADWVYEGQQTQLQPGDMLFLYTDGLTEAGNTARELLGRKHVQQLASAHCHDTAQQLIDLMVAEVQRHAGDALQSDDITLLAIKWQGCGFSMSASMDDIGRLEPFIAHAAKGAGLDVREAKRLRLAVEEAVANIINHGQATTIRLQATTDDRQLALTIDDDGEPFDPTADSATDFSVPADERPPGGLGIMFLHEMTDGLDYQRVDGRNVLKIIKVKK